MAGVGFELKKIFKDNSGILNSLKGYSVTAVVTEGPMILTILMLFMVRYVMRLYNASYREQEVYLFLLTYVMIFSLIMSNTVLMFINRYISDCIYNDQIESVLPSFYGVTFILLVPGTVLSVLYVIILPISIPDRILTVILFSCMLVLWVQMSYLSVIRQYTYILLGFLAGVILTIGISLIGMHFGMQALTAGLLGTSLGFFVMMVMFMMQMIAYYPMEEFHIFGFLPALDRYKILVAVGFLTALGLYAHNFVYWFSSYKNRIFPAGIFCTRYDIPTFYATLTIIPMMVRFVVSLETSFSEKNRYYFDIILEGGWWSEIKKAKKDMQKVLFRELLYLLEIQLMFTLLAATFGGNLLSRIGLDEGMTRIFRILCFGYCMYGLFKCMLILLLYFDDRKGACIGAAVFAGGSTVLSVLSLFFGENYWGSGFLIGAVIAVFYTMLRLRGYVERLEYHVFCEQPLFAEKTRGVFEKMEEEFLKREKEFAQRRLNDEKKFR